MWFRSRKVTPSWEWALEHQFDCYFCAPTKYRSHRRIPILHANRLSNWKTSERYKPFYSSCTRQKHRAFSNPRRRVLWYHPADYNELFKKILRSQLYAKYYSRNIFNPNLQNLNRLKIKHFFFLRKSSLRSRI